MLTIPFGEDSLATCESYFITDDGLESLKMLETYLITHLYLHCIFYYFIVLSLFC